MRSFIAFIFILSFSTAHADWIVQKSGDGKILVRKSALKIERGSKVLKRIPEFIIEGPGHEHRGFYEEILYSDADLPAEYRLSILDVSQPWVGSEVRTIVNQGPIENRIDLTIVGDGYVESEKEKFFEDALRISNDLFQEKTFSSYLPLFNVHAVFVPSKESGISDVVKKNTALGLYRSPAGSKRAIMPGNTMAIDRAIALAPDADYPILIANDDFYGGLGGRYAISTRSVESGKIVLRHELGHNFGEVGEEYDGGSVYSGANSSSSAQVPWMHWVEKNELRVFESKFLSGDYVWQNLNKKPYSSTFQFPKGDFILDILVSAVGWNTENDVHVLIDNQKQILNGKYTTDRTFFDIDTTLSPGNHTIQAKENIADGDNVLAFIQVIASPSDIVKDKHYVGAYATFGDWGKTYRPTYSTCIMRDMKSEEFCSVDKENFWHKFLNRVSVLDQVVVKKLAKNFEVEAITPSLLGLEFNWYKINSAGQAQKISKDQNSNKLSLSLEESGNYRVEVIFKTSEVRKYNSNFTATKDFKVF